MTEAQIKHMVQRFLGWKLPEHFNPDNGITFDPVMNKGRQFESRREPTGTNLFDADQANAMVRYMVEGIPREPREAPAGDMRTNYQGEVRYEEGFLADRLKSAQPGDVLARAIWDRIEAMIDASPKDGISAEGVFNERIAEVQRDFIDGMRSARLAAMNIVRAQSPRDERTGNAEMVAKLQALSRRLRNYGQNLGQVSGQKMANDVDEIIAALSTSQPGTEREGWREWNGGDQPVSDDVTVQVRFRGDPEPSGRAGTFHWGDTGGGADIIAYRVIASPPAATGER